MVGINMDSFVKAIRALRWLICWKIGIFRRKWQEISFETINEETANKESGTFPKL